MTRGLSSFARDLKRRATIRGCSGNGSTSLIMNDRGDLGNKAGAAFESHVTPQPGHGGNETIPKANKKIDVHCAPKHPANKALELNRTKFYDGGASTDGR